MLDSPEIIETVVQRIHTGNWAPGALRQTIESHAQRFELMDDQYLRERATDIRELGTRILLRLQDASPPLESCPPDSILIGRQISAIDLGSVSPGHLRGIISVEGSALSHAAIVARALGSRGIRLTLDHPDIFLTQLRAALRANIGLGNPRLLKGAIRSVTATKMHALAGRALQLERPEPVHQLLEQTLQDIRLESRQDLPHY